jgi:hypothetical protein
MFGRTLKQGRYATINFLFLMQLNLFYVHLMPFLDKSLHVFQGCIVFVFLVHLAFQLSIITTSLNLPLLKTCP